VDNQGFIPVCEPLLAGNELKYVTDAVASGWISSTGGYVGKFEQAFADYLGVAHAITCNSGTAALHLACKALGLGQGDEVILPTFTMTASAFAVTYCGAMPVFVDCDRETWTLVPEQIAAKITARTRAIMPVHIYGHPCDMDPILEVAARHDLAIIEDAAEALGSDYRQRSCGTLGQAGCFSFYANKLVTCGEGGMVVTDSAAIAEQVHYYKNMCFPVGGDRNYRHAHIGYNYRLPNTAAAIGLAQVERAGDYLAMRRRNAAHYNNALAAIPGLTLPVEKDWAINSYWMYGILIEDDFGLARDQVMAGLLHKGIDCRCFFQPMHQQGSLLAYGCNGAGDFPVAEELARRGLYLPSGSGLSEKQIFYIAQSLAQLRS